MTLAFNIGFLEIKWVDVLDIFLVAFLMYQVYKLMKGSVAIRVFLGFLSLYLIYLLVGALGMELLSSILGQFMGVGILALIILFQTEIRRFLSLIGKTTTLQGEGVISSFFRKKGRTELINSEIIVEVALRLSQERTGALIVFSKSSPLKFYSESGDLIDAEISKRLLLSIFNKDSPLHDGAVIIYEGRIKAARCILPISDKQTLPPKFGMRHRAAVGLSEITDAIILVVSEENGMVSLVRNGAFLQNLLPKKLKEELDNFYLDRRTFVGKQLKTMTKAKFATKPSP